MPSLIGFTQSSFDPASRVRFIQYVPGLEQAGWCISHRPNRPDRQWCSPLRNRLGRGLHYRAGRALMKWNRLRDIRDAAAFDVVFLNRDLAGSGNGRLERRLFARNHRVVFDFDDAIFVGEQNRTLVPWLCANAAWVTPGNEYLAEYARRYTPRVTVLPTAIDTDTYRPRVWNGEPLAAVRVGWSGSDQSIRTTLFPYLELLRQAQAESGFDLVIVSNTEPALPVDGIRWRFVPWSPAMEGDLGRRFDVGIMPLVDDAFQRGKCGLKLLQYMAAGLPTIASPVGVNREIALPGTTGFLPATPNDWCQALARLVASPELRARMGGAGRRRCEEAYSVRRWAPELLRVLERAREQRC